MKTLKEIEKEFEECAQSIMSEKEVEQFYRQAIAEILGEVAGKGNMNSEERIKQCGEYAKGDENLDCAIGFDDGFDAGYFQAKAEIRERIKSILE